MLRKLMVHGFAAAALALGLAGIAAPAALAATLTQLLLPQGTAFAILGHSCGGIQEKAYATGFDPASGYPTGVVLMSTSCGGSGRGGGYHSTLYSASANVTWDFTGAVVSYAAPATSGTWPPLLTSARPKAIGGVRAGLLGTIHSGGRLQVTYAGHPLYTYSGDTRSGEVNSQNLKLFGAKWFVVNTAGAAITKP